MCWSKTQHRFVSSQPFLRLGGRSQTACTGPQLHINACPPASGPHFASMNMPHNKAVFQTFIGIRLGLKNKPAMRARIRNAKCEPRQSGLTLCVPVSWPECGLQKKTTFMRLSHWDIRTARLEMHDLPTCLDPHGRARGDQMHVPFHGHGKHRMTLTQTNATHSSFYES